VIFFGLLGSQSGPAASAVAPQLRTALTATGVPAQFSGRIVTQFGSCLHDRLVSADPAVTPPSCRPGSTGRALPPADGRALATAGATAVRSDFAASLERTLGFQVGVFLLSFLLMLALPAGSGRRQNAVVARTPATRSRQASAGIGGPRMRSPKRGAAWIHRWMSSASSISPGSGRRHSGAGRPTSS
jgi:hypothetical protein